MATRMGLLQIEVEGQPHVLSAIVEILQECNDADRVELSNDLVADVQARLEGLAWAPPQDRQQKLLDVCVSAVMAYASLGAE